MAKVTVEWVETGNGPTLRSAGGRFRITPGVGHSAYTRWQLDDGGEFESYHQEIEDAKERANELAARTQDGIDRRAAKRAGRR